MNALVIGGNGFIGSHLVDYLLTHGHNVRVYDITHERFRKPLDNVDYRIAPIESISDLYESLLSIDIVYHLASTSVPSSSNIDTISDVSSNLISTLQILNLLVKLDLKRFVFFSSGGAVYGNPISKQPVSEEHPVKPISSYGIVKSTIENYLFLYQKLYGLKPLILRPSNAYGPRQGHFLAHGVISTFLRKTKMNEKLTVFGDGLTVKDYIYISDLVEVSYKLSATNKTGIYNIGSGIGISINQIIEKIGIITMKNLIIEYIDSQIYDVNNFVLDISRIKDSFNWSPSVSLEEGIKNTWDWFNMSD